MCRILVVTRISGVSVTVELSTVAPLDEVNRMDIPLVTAMPAAMDLSGGLPEALIPSGLAPPAHAVARRVLPWRRPLAVALVAAGWGAAVFTASRVTPSVTVHRAALFAHLLSLVVGLGAVVVLDTYGAGCLLNRRSPVTVAQFAASLDLLIWGGLAGLLVSGALLHPSLSSPLTWVKLAAVLAAGLNGVNAHGLRTAVAALPGTTSLRELPRPLLLRLAATAAVSQSAWWVAVLVGFWNNN
jgi:hypothetical protein